MVLSSAQLKPAQLSNMAQVVLWCYYGSSFNVFISISFTLSATLARQKCFLKKEFGSWNKNTLQ